ncbi:MAG: 16S rRNA (guanine(966)-N(2))-methyltransferase RsmD [Verrucomicrobia bacterium]|nr:16S rRNA (guanine(966)-N(2))-methyltransferase RsmD [Verrucomicrobiota bacterium]MBS0647106.1 16S rRNA (guanine(966)-N(2))-methyltransferase RsmD [Verrucomicrobiota bacterium]
MRIIAGKFKNRVLEVPKEVTRPTLGVLREAIFNICQGDIENACVLDLFAGSGAIGLEALSRGARHVIFVENNRQALKILHKNIASFAVENSCTIYPYDVQRALIQLQTKEEKFDLIYIDPPYGKQLAEKTLLQLDSLSLLKPHGIIFVEEDSSMSPDLKSLCLKSTRKISRSVLQQYVLKHY